MQSREPKKVSKRFKFKEQQFFGPLGVILLYVSKNLSLGSLFQMGGDAGCLQSQRGGAHARHQPRAHRTTGH